MIVTLDVDEPQLLKIVQAKTLAPKVRPLIVVVSKLIFAIVPLPETTDHDPVPTAAVLAAIVTTPLMQTVWFGPATAGVGNGSTVI